MATKGVIGLPPDSTGKQVGTWTDADGKHYHGFVMVDSDGDPIQWRYITSLLEQIVLLLSGTNVPVKDEERTGTR
jgi:hypothetical protein